MRKIKVNICAHKKRKRQEKITIQERTIERDKDRLSVVIMQCQQTPLFPYSFISSILREGSLASQCLRESVCESPQGGWSLHTEIYRYDHTYFLNLTYACFVKLPTDICPSYCRKKLNKTKIHSKSSLHIHSVYCMQHKRNIIWHQAKAKEVSLSSKWITSI